MIPISSALVQKIKSGSFVGGNTPTARVCLIVWNGLSESYIETEIPNVTEIRVNKDETAFCQSAIVKIANVKPSKFEQTNDDYLSTYGMYSPKDHGYFNPLRDDADHNKASNEWYHKLLPSKLIRIYMGYGSNIAVPSTDTDVSNGIVTWGEYRDVVPVFTGIIDSVTMDDSEMYIEARDMGRKLKEDYINSSVGGTKQFSIGYPITSETSVFLDSGDTNPDLSEVVKDLLLRAGFFNDYIDIEITGVGISDLSDGELYFEEIQYSEAIEQIKTITGYDFWTDYLGVAHFRSVLPHSFTVAYTFRNGEDIVSLPAVLDHTNLHGTVIVKGDGVTATSSIPSGEMWDGSSISLNKVLFVNDTNIVDQSAANDLASKIMDDMRHRYISTDFKCLAVPHVQLRDVIRIMVYGTMTQCYIVDSLELIYKDANIDMSMKTHFYSLYGD